MMHALWNRSLEEYILLRFVLILDVDGVVNNDKRYTLMTSHILSEAVVITQIYL